jgi:hypothetical protein
MSLPFAYIVAVLPAEGVPTPIWNVIVAFAEQVKAKNKSVLRTTPSPLLITKDPRATVVEEKAVEALAVSVPVEP